MSKTNKFSKDGPRLRCRKMDVEDDTTQVPFLIVNEISICVKGGATWLLWMICVDPAETNLLNFEGGKGKGSKNDWGWGVS